MFRQLNPNVTCENLQIGERLCLQDFSINPPQGAVVCSVLTPIPAGGTCLSIAGAGGISLDRLQELNPELNCTTLQAGASLCTAGTKLAPEVRYRQLLCVDHDNFWLLCALLAGNCSSSWQPRILILHVSHYLPHPIQQLPALHRLTSARFLTPSAWLCWPTWQTHSPMTPKLRSSSGWWGHVSPSNAGTCLHYMQHPAAHAALAPRLLSLLQPLVCEACFLSISPDIYHRQLQAAPSTQLSNEIGLRLIDTFLGPTGLGTATALESRYGRAYWVQVMFPAGLPAYCSGLNLGPSSAARACICSTAPAPVLMCAAFLYQEVGAQTKRAAANPGPATPVRRRRLQSARLVVRIPGTTHARTNITTQTSPVVSAQQRRLAAVPLPFPDPSTLWESFQAWHDVVRNVLILQGHGLPQLAGKACYPLRWLEHALTHIQPLRHMHITCSRSTNPHTDSKAASRVYLQEGRSSY